MLSQKSSYEAVFMIRNSGEEPIENVELIFAIEELSSLDFLDIILTNSESVEELTGYNLTELDPPDAFTLHLPFLNPYKDYEDYLGVTLYSPEPILVKGVVGKGVGWTTKYIDKTAYYDKVIQALSSAASPVGYLTGKILEIWVR